MIQTEHSELPVGIRARTGFVLVAVLLVVALATVLVVATSMVSSVERMAASNSLAVERARANALFALEVALDQIQSVAGPDQRTSARADILQTGSTTLAQPHWTGIWKTYNPDKPDAYDLDVGADALRPWSLNSEGPTWLVPQPDPASPVNPQSFTGTTTGSNRDAVVIASKIGSLGVSGSASDVTVPLRKIRENTGTTGTVGAYAYWVADEGIKAKVNLSPNAASSDASNPMRYLAPATLAAEQALAQAFRSSYLSGSGTGLSKIKHPAMLEFLLGGNFSSDPAGLPAAGPDITTHSMGVLSDTRKGGLKTDLTAAFESLNSDAVSSTQSAFERLCARKPAGRDETNGGTDDALQGKLWRLPGVTGTNSAYLDGVRFHPLFLYYNLYKQQVPRFANPDNPWNPRRPLGLGGIGGAAVEYGLMKKSSLPEVPLSRLVPAIVGFRYGVYFSTINNGTAIRFHYAPRLVLHNPYSVPIKPGTDGTIADFQFTNNFFNMSGVTVTIRNLTTGSTIYNGRPQLDAVNPDVGPANSNLSFTPGEIKIFGGAGVRKGPSYFRYNLPDEYPLVSNFNESFNYWDPPLTGTLSPSDRLEITMRTRVGDANSVRWIYATANRRLGFFLRNPLIADATHTLISGEPASSFLNNPGDPPTPLAVIFMRAKGFNPEHTPCIPAFGSGALWNPFSISKNSYFWETDVLFKATYDDSDEIQTDGAGRSYWGSCDVGRGVGQSQVVLKEIFDRPLVSIGQLKNCDPVFASTGERYQESLIPVGNSWPNPELTNTSSGNQVDLWKVGTSVAAVDDLFLNNEALFDRFFFSTVPPATLPTSTTLPPEWAAGFNQASVDSETPLLNPRLKFHGANGASPVLADLRDMDKAAANLLVDGAFNVNSTSPAAWRALFASLRFVSKPSDAHPVPRIVSALTSKGTPPSADDYTAGIRVLTDSQLDSLARAMVDQVRLRGPFLSMADFVNRRRQAGALGENGALQAAIDASGINESALSTLGQRTDLQGPKPGDPILTLPAAAATGADWFIPGVVPAIAPNTADGAPGVITQADLLQPLAPILVARSDTFVIRVFGESGVTTPAGQYLARGKAFGEAVVQRFPEFLDPSEAAYKELDSVTATNRLLGRRFRAISFRWLDPDEI